MVFLFKLSRLRDVVLFRYGDVDSIFVAHFSVAVHHRIIFLLTPGSI